jgi:hypothetical protein
MKTRLDREIEQLENIVERCLDLCHAEWNGVRCTLPANHEPAESHKFPVQFRQALALLGGSRAKADSAVESMKE